MIVEYAKALILGCLSVLLLAFALQHVIRRYQERPRLPSTPLSPDDPVLTSGSTFPENILDMDRGSFQQVLDLVDEDLSVYSRIAVYANATQNIFVHRNGTLLLYGLCAGNLVIHAQASAAVYGTVVGSISNMGGELHIFGKVIGQILTTDGETKVHPTAQLTQPLQDAAHVAAV